MKRSVMITYITLTLLLMACSAFLAFQVKHYMKAIENDPLADVRVEAPTEEQIKRQLRQEEIQERQSILTTYNLTKSFTALATPRPEPTPTPLPPPTPVPILPANNWKYLFVSSSMAMLWKYDDTRHTAKVGDVLQDAKWGNFKVVELIPDIERPRVKVEHVESGKTGFIDERHKPGG